MVRVQTLKFKILNPTSATKWNFDPCYMIHVFMKSKVSTMFITVSYNTKSSLEKKNYFAKESNFEQVEL